MAVAIAIASDAMVQPISASDARSLVRQYHYLGAKGFRCGRAYGLYRGIFLSGAAVFHGLSAPETAVGAFGLQRTDQDGLWELGRLVLVPELNGGNYGTWFLARAIKMLRGQEHVRALISYASADLHTGGIYRAASFLYCGLTAPKQDFYVQGRIQERGATRGVLGEWRARPQKHRFVRVFDRSLSLKWPLQKSRAEAALCQ